MEVIETSKNLKLNLFQYTTKRVDLKDRRCRHSRHPGERAPPASHRDVQDPQGHLLRAHAAATSPRTDARQELSPPQKRFRSFLLHSDSVWRENWRPEHDGFQVGGGRRGRSLPDALQPAAD
jgi:hypothetical protein